MIWRYMTKWQYSLLDTFATGFVGGLYGSGATTAAVVVMIGWGIGMLFQRQP